MAFACGISQYNVGFFHLINHGCFKALLFLGVGSLIHSLENKQDIRTLGNLLETLPANYSMFLVGSLTLAGFPFLSGFYSKDLMIELSFVNYSFYGRSIYIFSLFIAILTTIYSTRLIYFLFLKKTNLNKDLFLKRCESGFFITFSLLTLTFLSIFNGYIFSDLFVGLGSDYFNTTLFKKPEHYTLLNAEFENIIIKNIPLFFTIVTISMSLYSLHLLKWKILYSHSNLYHISIFLVNR